MRFAATSLLLSLSASTACGRTESPRTGQPVDWSSYAGDPASTRYSPLDDINRHNVGRLRSGWVWDVGERRRPDPRSTGEIMPGAFEATPIALGDTLYLTTPLNRAVALDARTGRELWSYDPQAYRWGRIADQRGGFVHRGLAMGQGPEGRRLFLASRGWLIALDARTGQPVRAFGDTGVVDLLGAAKWPVDRSEVSNTSPPLVWGGLVIVGGTISDAAIHPKPPPGSVQAFDARTGTPVWRWDPMPAPGDPARASWLDGAAELNGHMNVWSAFAVDSARGLLFAPVSAATNDWYGGNRLGADLFSESLVCLDARTGALRWHYQIVHHGLWDYDPAAPPILLTVTVNGQIRDIVALAGKTGFLYVFDRMTGTPVWPIEERPVPASDVPGERSAPTQPFPTRPAPFARQGITPADLVDFTPEIHRRALASVAPYRLGPLFTPPSLAGTVVLPGWIGGAGWGSAAADPRSGVIFVKSTNRPVLALLRPLEPAAGNPWTGYRLDEEATAPAPLTVELPGGPQDPVSSTQPPARIPLVRPPYGTLTAVDLNTGEQRWQVTLGDTPWIRNHPQLRGLRLPPLGADGPGGGLVTAGGLIFIAGGATLYAIDVADGTVRWEHALSATSNSNPMTFRNRDGRQYVVVAVGGGERARLEAFALPD